MVGALRGVVVACVIACLSACAVAPTQQSAVGLSKTHGYVYVNLPKELSGGHIVLRSMKDKSEHVLLKRSDLEVQAYGRWVPEGSYALSGWLDYQLSGYPQINVVAGTVTDMGSLLAWNIGANEAVILPVRHPELETLISSAVLEHRDHLVSSDVIRWEPKTTPNPIKLAQRVSGLGLIADLLLAYERKVNTPPLSKQLRAANKISDFFSIAKSTTPPAFAEPASDELGNLYYGADFGQIRVRSASGVWSSVDVGTLRPITAVEISDQKWLAGTDNGLVWVSQDKGSSWEQVAAFGTNEVVVDVDHIKGKWIVITASVVKMLNGTNGVSSANVHMASSSDFSDVRMIKKIPMDPNTYAGNGALGETDGRYYYLNAFPDLLRLDVESQQWKVVSPPTKVHGFHAHPRDSVLTAFRIMGAFSKLFISADHGETWQARNAPPYVILDVHMSSKGSGEAARWRMDAFSGAIEFMSYNQGSDRWIRSSEAPSGCAVMLRDIRHRPSFCVTRGGDILAVKENKWDLEFSAN